MNHTPPEHLDPVATAKWREIVLILKDRGDIDQGHLDALAAYAVAWSRWVQAEEQVKALGLICKSPSGFPTENPYLGVVKRALIELHRWEHVLGLDRKPGQRKAATPGDEPTARPTLRKWGATG